MNKTKLLAFVIVLISVGSFAQDANDTTCSGLTFPVGVFDCDTLLKVKKERAKILEIMPESTDCQDLIGPFPQTLGIEYYKINHRHPIE